ncbi:hypothetical protein KSP40_PGU004663 [Platanthera guangdongensis]|uniref:Uncharacterized protein n=1 Tax=Platanthera guangdongensis TaxID=2320717 RepID=A0ABR2LGD4_9ASPA
MLGEYLGKVSGLYPAHSWLVLLCVGLTFVIADFVAILRVGLLEVSSSRIWVWSIDFVWWASLCIFHSELHCPQEFNRQVIRGYPFAARVDCSSCVGSENAKFFNKGL